MTADIKRSEAALMEGYLAEKMKTLQKLREQMPFWEELHRKNEKNTYGNSSAHSLR